jgi:CHAT domain-containing protein
LSNDAVLDFIGLIYNAPRGKKSRAAQLRAALEEVGAAVWRPMLREWPELRHEPFAVVPIGETAQLPLFTALIDDVPAGAEFDMTITPSARALLLAASRSTSKLNPAIILADTAEGLADLPAIPLTDGEAREIATTHGVVSTIFRDAQGRAGTTDGELLRLMSSAGLVHLACHGTINHAEPFDSILHLGPGLRLQHIWERRLPAAPLIVLSACDIGGISTELPSEQLGFPAVLLASGARAVVGALWPVPEVADTARLMLEFHRLLRSGRPPNLALGSAIASMNTANVSPSVWGPFTHIGATSPQS